MIVNESQVCTYAIKKGDCKERSVVLGQTALAPIIASLKKKNRMIFCLKSYMFI